MVSKEGKSTIGKRSDEVLRSRRARGPGRPGRPESGPSSNVAVLQAKRQAAAGLNVATRRGKKRATRHGMTKTRRCVVDPATPVN